MKTCGIYSIVHLESGRCYIGSSIDVVRRLKRHRYDLNHDRHHNSYLQRAWNKYGELSFQFLTVETNVSAVALHEREQAHLDAASALTFNKGPCAAAPHRGTKYSAEHNARVSAALKGRPKSEAHCAAMREAWKLRTVNPEHIAKMIASNRGRKHTPEHVEKVRSKHLGRKRTGAALARMRWAYTTRAAYHPTPEHRAKISAAAKRPHWWLKWKKQPPEQIAARVAQMTGKKRTPEFRSAQSARIKAWWAERKQEQRASI